MSNSKVALVTGGMGGLGTALCRHLYDAGFTVALTYSPGNTTPEGWLAAQRDDGYRFTAYRLDVTDFAACETTVARLLAELAASMCWSTTPASRATAACARWGSTTGTPCCARISTASST